MRFVLFLLAKSVALVCGAELLSYPWLLATFALDYVRAIFAESENAPGGNFRNLSDGDFGKSEANIKMATLRNLLVSAIFFGIGFAAKSFGWI